MNSMVPQAEFVQAECTLNNTGQEPHLAVANSIFYSIEKNNIDKHRERNRQHAKKTRQRKKEMIEGTKVRLLELHQEALRLEELLEECRTASILMGLSATDPSPEDSSQESELNLRTIKGNIVEELRQQVRLEAAQRFRGSHDQVGFVPQSEDDNNVDENYLDSEEMDDNSSSIERHDFDHEEKNTPKKIADIKRRRNRLHAKLTRDRRKLFFSKMQKEILTLESNNQVLREKLFEISPSTASGNTSCGSISSIESII